MPTSTKAPENGLCVVWRWFGSVLPPGPAWVFCIPFPGSFRGHSQMMSLVRVGQNLNKGREAAWTWYCQGGDKKSDVIYELPLSTLALVGQCCLTRSGEGGSPGGPLTNGVRFFYPPLSVPNLCRLPSLGQNLLILPPLTANNICEWPLTHTIQGCTKRWAPGCVKMR